MPKKIIFNKEEIDKIINLYKSGISCKEIGKQFKCSKQVININLKNNNIVIRDNSHAQQKYTINENIFSKIDSQEKAYWLGMLTGDGWITDRNELGLSLQEKDKNHIFLFKNFLSSTHPIKIINNGIKKNGNPSISYELKLSNKKIVLDLKKYGFSKNKTKYIKFPNINKKYLASYMLGLIDSDGSFCLKSHYKNKDKKLLSFNFIGPTEFTETFQKLLINNCNISKTKLGIQKNTNFVRTVNYGGYKNIYKIVKFLYSGTNIFMQRKKSIAIKYLLEKYPNDQWLQSQLY
jgi:hypothetical protein